MLLDTRTIIFMTAAICLLIAAQLLLAWRHNRAERTLAWWSGSFLAFSLGTMLFVPRGHIPDLLSIDLGNSLILIGIALAWAGSRAFDGRDTPAAAILVGAAAWLLACRVPEFYASAAWRMALVSALFAGYALAVAVEYWRGRADRLTSRYMLIAAYAALAASYGARAPFAFLVPPPSELMAPNYWFALSVLIPVLIGVASSVLVVSVTKERAEAALRRAAALDPLTGTLNRGAMLGRAGAELAACRACSKPSALLVFDLDRFKQINDRFGHPAGDRVLAGFVDIAQANLRGSDVFGRIGGEEFAAFLPDTSEADAEEIAERIRSAFASRSVMHLETAVPATVSIGIATATADSGLDQMLLKADRALYAAKEGGRDRVRHAAAQAA